MACLFELAPVALLDERDDVQNESGPHCGDGKLVGGPRIPPVRTVPRQRSTVTGKEMNTYRVRDRCSAEVVSDKFGDNRTFPLAVQQKSIISPLFCVNFLTYLTRASFVVLTDSSIDRNLSTFSEYIRSSEEIGEQYRTPEVAIGPTCDTTGENRLGE